MVLFVLALVAAIAAAIGLVLVGLLLLAFLIALVAGPLRARIHTNTRPGTHKRSLILHGHH